MGVLVWWIVEYEEFDVGWVDAIESFTYDSNARSSFAEKDIDDWYGMLTNTSNLNYDCYNMI